MIRPTQPPTTLASPNLTSARSPGRPSDPASKGRFPRALPYTVLWAPLLAMVLWGCGDAPPDPPPDTPQPTTGTVKLAFSASRTVRESSALKEPLRGKIYGSLFLSEDVGLTGPRDGVEGVDDVQVEVDIVDVEVSDAVWESKPLPPANYIFLGFFDVDGNGSETFDPDAGDPVTFPVSNKFDIVVGQTVETTVIFELVLN